MRTFNEDNAIRDAGTPDAYAVGTHYGPYIDMSQIGRRVTFIGTPGKSMGGNVTMSLEEAQNTSGLGAQALTHPASQVFAAGTDDGLPGVMEMRDVDFSSNLYDCVRVKWVVAGGTTDFQVTAIFSELYERPASNVVNTDVAFVTGE